MPLPIIRGFYFLSIHLLFASGVCLVAWILTSLRHGSAATKHWIWVATALNFGLPVAALLDSVCAPHLSWARPLRVIGAAVDAAFGNARVAAVLCAVWSVGALLMLARLGVRLRRERAARPAVSRERFRFDGVPVCVEESPRVPAVRGFLLPRIWLPSGIDLLLSPAEMRAVLLHEATHARRRDNLIRLVQELVLCAVWFHPLAWLTSARVALYRELSCDESVVDRALGRDLVQALGKLARPERAGVLEATASSFLPDRLALLDGGGTGRSAPLVDVVLTAAFAVVLLLAVYETISHTACCFVPVT
ncbi:MAG TPA: M56 family metallopeptidase [Myxococcaceae bacterium]|jgi:beta-lactamase regulating signal transducer with metallopeptidase domain